jgi:FMN phosphatase YigB (HAD superfamily)
MVGNEPDADINGAIAAGWKAVYIYRDVTSAFTACPTISTLDELPPLLAASGT